MALSPEAIPDSTDHEEKSPGDPTELDDDPLALGDDNAVTENLAIGTADLLAMCEVDIAIKDEPEDDPLKADLVETAGESLEHTEDTAASTIDRPKGRQVKYCDECSYTTTHMGHLKRHKMAVHKNQGYYEM